MTILFPSIEANTASARPDGTEARILTAAPLGMQRHLEHPFPRLMSHYVAVTSVTLPFFSDRGWVWQSALPYYAEGNAYLRHSLLALSALHISHLSPNNPRESYVAACAHQLRASSLFRKTVLEVNEHNCSEVFAFVVIVAIFHFYVSLQAGLLSGPTNPLMPSRCSPLCAAGRGWYLRRSSTCLIAAPWRLISAVSGTRHSSPWMRIYDKP
jgi:hypothetical protein